MDVKTAFLNGNLFEDVYINQLDGFIESSKDHMVCKLRKSIYGLKQASRQWYLTFDNVVTFLGFKKNIVDQCIYLKFSESKFIILVLYVDDILLASNDVDFLHETKQMLMTHFDAKALGNTFFVLGIEIHRDISNGILGSSQKSYIKRILDRFNMKFCKPWTTPIQKGEKYSKSQCPHNDCKIVQMEKIPYASAICSLMYVQVCTHPDIAFVVNVLGRYLSNPGLARWQAAKQVEVSTRYQRLYVDLYKI